MAGLSRASWSLLQQLTSDDLADNDRLSGRDVVDALRHLALDPAGTVLGGFELKSHAANSLIVGPGMLLARYTAGPGAPRADESPTLLGRVGEDGAQVPFAPPTGAIWSLLEARPLERATTSDRLVYDPAAKNFEPKSVTTRVEEGVEFQIKAGTETALPTPDAGWVPLYGLHNIAGSSEIDDYYDLRPRFERAEFAGRSALFAKHEYAVLQKDTRLLRISVDFRDQQGLRLSADLTTTLDAILAPDYSEPATDGWIYLYLAPWQGLTPLGTRGDVRGILIASSVPPAVQGDRRNGAAIASPAPFGSIPAGVATAFGALRTQAVTWLQTQNCIRGRLSFSVPYYVGSAAAEKLPADFAPKTARTAYFRARLSSKDPSTIMVWTPSAVESPTLETAYCAFCQVASEGSTLMPPLYLSGADISDVALSAVSGTQLDVDSFDL